MSDVLVEPYLLSAFGFAPQTIGDDDLWIASIAALFVFVVLFAGVGRPQKTKHVDVYLSGVSIDDGARTYRSALSQPLAATSRNMYLETLFGERSISPVGTAICSALAIVALVVTSAPYASLVLFL